MLGYVQGTVEAAVELGVDNNETGQSQWRVGCLRVGTVVVVVCVDVELLVLVSKSN